jgi:diguanylate cyclase (GGDEF)-like protein
MLEERRRRPRTASPTIGSHRLIVAGLILAAVAALTALAAVWVATATVNDAAVAGEMARANAALAALTADGETPGPLMAARLERDFLLAGAHFAAPGSVGADEAAIAAGAGGVLAWTPRLLGNDMVARLAPVRLLVSALFVGALIFVIYRLFRLTTQLDELRRDAREAADRDAVTAAASRLAFEDGLRDAFAGGPPQPLALLYLDLDDFKAVNDRFGHAAGDTLLRQVAERLLAGARPGDLVARLGGDEFAVLRAGFGSRSELAAEMAALSERLLAPYQLGVTELTIRVSIGAALAPQDARTPEALVRAADRALYRVKADRTRFFAFADEARLPRPARRPHAA